MRIMHNHVCSFTSKPSTCYVFDEFPLLFSLSVNAFDQLKESLEFAKPTIGHCSFCDKTRDVRGISGFSNSVFYGDMNICESCMFKMDVLVEPYEDHFEHS